MKAAFLIRCSTKKQDLGRQITDLSRLADDLGFEYDLDNLVYGEKITGKDDITKRNRESIEKLFKGAKEQKFDVVLVSEVSRMSRDPLAGRTYVNDLIQMGVPVYFKDINEWSFEPGTTPTDTDIRNKLVSIGGAFDAAWKYLRSMKTQIASARRNQLYYGAISVGKPFFGYRWFGGNDKLTKTKWVEDELTAGIVLEVFNEYLKEGSTLKSTALAITDRFGEQLNRKFSIGAIEHILSFESYHTGIKEINLTDPDKNVVELYKVEIPKLIPSELYEKAKAKREGNRVKKEPYGKQTTYLLSKLIKCPCCGYTMTPRIKSNEAGKCANGGYRIINGKKAMSWMCMSGVNNATICKNRMSVANEKLEPIIWELVKRELIAFANLNDEDRENKVKEIEANIENLSYNIQNYAREADKLTKKQEVAIKEVVETMAIITDEATKNALRGNLTNIAQSYTKEREGYENNIEQAKAEIEKLTTLKTIYSQPNLPKDVIEKAEANPVEQRNLIKELVFKITPHKITTFQKYQREKGKGANRNMITMRFGIVLLEVDTINGIYYIFYNANGKEATRYAYYVGTDIVYSGSDFATDYIKGLGNEVFYIKSPYLLFAEDDDRVNDMDAVVDVNGFVEIAKNNNWVLEYEYKPEPK